MARVGLGIWQGYLIEEVVVVEDELEHIGGRCSISSERNCGMERSAKLDGETAG